RDADDDADLLLAGEREEGPPRVLLEEVVDDLERREGPRGHDLVAVLRAADRRPQGGAVGADLPLALEVLERGEEVIPKDGVHAGVVELVEVDPVGPEPAQARLAG